MGKFAVILAAAGKSSRFADPHQKKVFTRLGEKPMWMISADLFSRRNDVGQIIVVISPDDEPYFREKFGASAALLGIDIVLGGAERADSVLCGLAKVKPELEFVAVHDAARPCVTDADVDNVFASAKTHGAAILATRCHSTLKRGSSDKTIVETVPRDELWLAQTPQVFRTDLLKSAYEQHPSPSSATDDAAIVEATGQGVALVEGSLLNIKVTTKSDLSVAKLALKATPQSKPFPFG
ncbi:MAG: 2-C-methyl-D-erythritol 4-phosphate cytidylyltransferase [Aureliella sp.]